LICGADLRPTPARPARRRGRGRPPPGGSAPRGCRCPGWWRCCPV